MQRAVGVPRGRPALREGCSVSASNTDAEMQEKTRAYLAAGAQEVWLVAESGAVRYFDATGEQSASRYPVILELPPPARE